MGQIEGTLSLRNAGAPVNGTNEVQTLTFGGTPEGGTFKLAYEGQITDAITWTAVDNTLIAAIQTALRALATIGSAGVTVTDGTLTAGIGTVLITFGGNLAKLVVPNISVYLNSLTGTNPTLAVAETTPGVTATGRGAAVGALLLDTTNSVLYKNDGTALEPSWNSIGDIATTEIANNAVTNDKLNDITRGSVKVGGAANAPTDLDAKTSGQILVGDGTDIKSVAVSGDVTLAANGAVTIADNAVSEGKIADADLPISATLVVGVEGGDTINVAIQLKDGGAGADIAYRAAVKAYLSNDVNGDSLATNAPSGGCAIGTDGLLIPVTPALTNALLVDGNLAIDAVAEKFKTTQSAAFLLNGVSHVKAPETAVVFTAAHVITASKFGVILIQINSAGVITTKVPASPQAYDDAPTALAALPAPDAGNIALGHIAIENNVGDWTANTDDLTNASDVTTASFVDASQVAIGGAKEFSLTSESDGDVDVNIVESGVATWYLIIVRPNGKLVASAAITFA